jgi:hypothetical protein
MLMLGTVLTHLREKVGLVISSVMKLIQHLLLKLTGVLTAIKILFAGNLTNLSLHLALIVQKFKALLASLTTVALLIKAVCTIVRQTLTQIGSLLLTTAHQILQLVLQALKSVLSLVKKDSQVK